MVILHVPYYGSIIAIDDIIASDNITALALKALLKYNRLSTIEIKNVYVYVYILRMRIWYVKGINRKLQ